MHKIYKSKGEFDIIGQLPQIIYSFLISLIFSLILETLTLTEGIILDFKKIRSIKKLNEKFISLGNKIKIKLLLYFILSTIFLLFFWYYLSMFCVIYKYSNSFNKRYLIEFCYIFNRTIIYLFNTWLI